MSTANKNQQAREVGRFIWGYRARIAIGSLATMLFLGAGMSPWWLVTGICLPLVGLAVWQRARVVESVHRTLYGSKIKREVVRAARDAGFGDLYVDDVEPTLPGEWVKVRVPRGKTIEKLDLLRREMRACLHVTDVRVVADREDPSGSAQLSIIRRDPFTQMGGAKWPLADAERVNIRDGVPYGLTEYGREFNARVLSRNIILGGAPDAGKSVALRPFAAAAALDPMVKLWMMDAKPNAVEFGMWAPVTSGLVRGRDLDAAVDMFEVLAERVEKRYYEISARGLEFVADDMELDVLMIDELPQFTRSFEEDTNPQKAAVKAIRGGIWKLIAMGRAAGMITILSAQKPTADVVPTEFRDLIDHKFALHCNTKAMSDAILGQGAGEESVANAAEIPSGQPGVGYYVSDNGVQKIRSFQIPRQTVNEIVSRVSSRQLDDELSTLSA